MANPITFTLDLEDHRPDDSVPVRFPAVVTSMLDWLDERNVTGTFFVVGAVAAEHPDLVRSVAARGHEIALHGWEHVPLVDLDPDGLRDHLRRGRAVLEDLAGAPVEGFRAPTFSLVPATAWATEVLAEEGFTYSSSLLAAHNPLYGWPGAPSEPFCWPSGLGEFPVPLAGLGSMHLPYLGGTYLRLLPTPVIDLARWWCSGWSRERSRTIGRRGREGRTPWTYVHAYDLDTGERFWWVPDAGRLAPLLWVGRRRVLDKLDHLLAEGAGPPLRDRLGDAHRGGTYHPAGLDAVLAGVGVGAPVGDGRGSTDTEMPAASAVLAEGSDT